MGEEIKTILRQAVNIERWADKSDLTYSFLNDDEVEEIMENILTQLDKNGYKIIKVN